MNIATTRTISTGTSARTPNSVVGPRAILLLLLLVIWGHAEGDDEQPATETAVTCFACKAHAEQLDFLRGEERLAADEWVRAKKKVLEHQRVREEEEHLWSEHDRAVHNRELSYWEGRRDRAVEALASIKSRIAALEFQLAQCETNRCPAGDAGGAIGSGSGTGAEDGSDTGYCPEVDWNTYLDPYYEARDARLKEWQAAHEAAEKVRGHISGISDIFLQRGRDQLPDTASDDAVQELRKSNAQLLQILKSSQDQLRELEAEEKKAREALDKANQELLDAERRADEQCREAGFPKPQSRATIRGSVGYANVSVGTTGASAQSTPLGAASQQRSLRSAQAISGGFLEESVVESDDTLSGIRLGVAFDKPLTDSAGPASRLSRAITELADRLPVERAPGAETLRVRASIVDADGSASAVRPVGELSAIILADESPLFGPGLALLRDGQRASIDTELRQFQLEAGVSVPVGDTVGTSAGLGLVLQSFDLEHDMFQQDILFPEVSARTDLDVNDIFIGPEFTFNKSSRSGDWDILWELHAAPGLLFGDGDVTQQINIFEATDRIRLSDSHTKLALQAGIRGALFKMITRQVALGFTGGIQYQSANSAWRNPLLVSDQPANLETDSTTTFDIGAFIYIPLGPQPVN